MGPNNELEWDPESDRLGHPPPPPTHHDIMKIYRKSLPVPTSTKIYTIHRSTCFLIFFWRFFWHTKIYGAQLERDPASDRLGHPPPPPMHHDLKKIYRVYRYLHQQKYTLPSLSYIFGHQQIITIFIYILLFKAKQLINIFRVPILLLHVLLWGGGAGGVNNRLWATNLCSFIHCEYIVIFTNIYCQMCSVIFE